MDFTRQALQMKFLNHFQINYRFLEIILALGIIACVVGGGEAFVLISTRSVPFSDFFSTKEN